MAEQSANFGFGNREFLAEIDFFDGLLQGKVEEFRADFLLVNADFYGFITKNLAVVNRQASIFAVQILRIFTQNRTNQARFPSTISPEKFDFFANFQIEIHIFEKDFRAVFASQSVIERAVAERQILHANQTPPRFFRLSFHPDFYIFCLEFFVRFRRPKIQIFDIFFINPKTRSLNLFELEQFFTRRIFQTLKTLNRARVARTLLHPLIFANFILQIRNSPL